MNIFQRISCFFWIIAVCTGLFPFGCKNDSSNSGPPAPVYKTYKGIFLDSAVEGIDYEYGHYLHEKRYSQIKGWHDVITFVPDGVGITDKEGIFFFESSHDSPAVKFKLGKTIIGTVGYKPIITIWNLVSDAKNEQNHIVTNIAKLLLTIDDDNNPANGISITEKVRKSALEKNITMALSKSIAEFETDSEVQRLVSDITVQTSARQRSLASTEKAQGHFLNTLMSLKENPRISYDYTTRYQNLLDGYWTPLNQINVCRDTKNSSPFPDACCAGSMATFDKEGNLNFTYGSDEYHTFYLIDHEFLTNFLSEKGLELDWSEEKQSQHIILDRSERDDYTTASSVRFVKFTDNKVSFEKMHEISVELLKRAACPILLQKPPSRTCGGYDPILNVYTMCI